MSHVGHGVVLFNILLYKQQELTPETSGWTNGNDVNRVRKLMITMDKLGVFDPASYKAIVKKMKANRATTQMSKKDVKLSAKLLESLITYSFRHADHQYRLFDGAMCNSVWYQENIMDY